MQKDVMSGSQVVMPNTQILQLMLTPSHSDGASRLQAVSSAISCHISESSISTQMPPAKQVNMQRISLMIKCHFLSPPLMNFKWSVFILLVNYSPRHAEADKKPNSLLLGLCGIFPNVFNNEKVVLQQSKFKKKWFKLPPGEADGLNHYSL